MSANRLFLVCSHHPNLEDALCLGERADAESQYTTAISSSKADEWFAKHMTCARGCDHFQLAYHRPQDHDVPRHLRTTAQAVRMALVNGSRHG